MLVLGGGVGGVLVLGGGCWWCGGREEREERRWVWCGVVLGRRKELECGGEWRVGGGGDARFEKRGRGERVVGSKGGREPE